MTSAVRLALPLVLVCTAFAQTQPHYEFEVASIRPSEISPQGQVNIGIHIDGSQFRLVSLPLRDCIAFAWSIQVPQISGPDWIASERYTIAATLPEGAAGHEREMLQSLLIDRFRLKLHREKRDFSVYSLTAAKGSLKMKESAPDVDDPDPAGTTNRSGGGSEKGVAVNLGHGASYSFVPNRFEAKKLTMPQFASALQRFADRQIVDQTELKGGYDFSFDVSPDDYQPMLIRAAVNSGVSLPPQALHILDSSSPALAGAVAQVGLKLEPRKLPLDVIVIEDALKKPVEN